ncbi:MAG: DUF3656 domain-containing protein [Planctomycetota bacterium]|nr:DUF3656 domain-containing protein [Planctomycetota bacterium]MDA1212423.1 DUF3656 domain-containing protein [Planctomycetota bacterium]
MNDSPPTSAFIKPELLAPAGDRDCIRAAIENGADAVYFGLASGFNARARAANISIDDVDDVMRELHSRGVKGYVTLNTLIFSNELDELERHVRAIAQAGVDAVLVQDLGAARLIRAICPDLPIHASTQMSLTSAEGIAAVEELGIERVVLPRELSLDEIRKIGHASSVPLEAFVHGALCVAYSGQCLTSESLGGRSANRGQCAQACRMPYELICDGEDVDLGNQKYLLSPQDLAAYDLVPELIEAGVISFKIEGRLKTPEYVANITSHYRRAIDAAFEQRTVQFTDNDVREMELSFSRGFSHGWLEGCDHKMLVPAVSSAKRGIFLGTVESIRGKQISITLAAPLSRGDGVVFEGDRFAKEEQGGRVYEVSQRGKRIDVPISSGVVELEFAHGAIDAAKLRTGQSLWKTDDPQLTKRLRKTFTGSQSQRRVPVDIAVHAETGKSIVLSANTATGVTATVTSEQPLARAEKHPLTIEMLREQMSRLGKTAYELRDVTAEIIGAPMLPLSLLSQLRKELITQLDARSTEVSPRRIAEGSVLADFRKAIPPSDETQSSPRLWVLCRKLSQLHAVLEAGVRQLYVDFQDIREYREAVQIAHTHAAEIFLATPRIQKPGERGIFLALAKHGADGILARNLGAVAYYASQDIRFVTDFSLNPTNELTVQYLRDRGAQRVTASYDMNRDQLIGVVNAVPPTWWEIVIHQHMPMFHMEHCVFCAVMSPGTNKTNCGRPCDVHEVKLRDQIGMEHPLTADVGCRNTLFNATPQSGAELVPTLLQHGIGDYRIELLHDEEREIPRVIDLYQSLLAGKITGTEVWTQLKALNRIGVTRGTLETKRDPLAIL